MILFAKYENPGSFILRQADRLSAHLPKTTRKNTHPSLHFQCFLISGALESQQKFLPSFFWTKNCLFDENSREFAGRYLGPSGRAASWEQLPNSSRTTSKVPPARNASQLPLCHRSHFGSRYHFGRCGLAGLPLFAANWEKLPNSSRTTSKVPPAHGPLGHFSSFVAWGSHA